MPGKPGRKALGERPMTPTERVTRSRQHQAKRALAMQLALQRIQMAKTIAEARAVATDILLKV